MIIELRVESIDDALYFGDIKRRLGLEVVRRADLIFLKDRNEFYVYKTRFGESGYRSLESINEEIEKLRRF